VSEGAVDMQTPSQDTPRIAIVEKEDESMEDNIKGLMNIGVDEGEKSSGICVEEEVGDHGKMEEAERVVEASDLVEVEGDLPGGCAVGKPEVLVEGIKGERQTLVKDTQSDPSLRVARGLAEKEQEGYSYKDGVILRARVDRSGEIKSQICLPKSLREGSMYEAGTL